MKKKKNKYEPLLVLLVGSAFLGLGSALLSLDLHVNYWLLFGGVDLVVLGAIELFDALRRIP